MLHFHAQDLSISFLVQCIPMPYHVVCAQCAGSCSLAADPTPPVARDQCAAAALSWVGDAGKAALAYNYTGPTCNYGSTRADYVAECTRELFLYLFRTCVSYSGLCVNRGAWRTGRSICCRGVLAVLAHSPIHDLTSFSIL